MPPRAAKASTRRCGKLTGTVKLIFNFNDDNTAYSVQTSASFWSREICSADSNFKNHNFMFYDAQNEGSVASRGIGKCAWFKVVLDNVGFQIHGLCSTDKSTGQKGMKCFYCTGIRRCQRSWRFDRHADRQSGRHWWTVRHFFGKGLYHMFVLYFPPGFSRYPTELTWPGLIPPNIKIHVPCNTQRWDTNI